MSENEPDIYEGCGAPGCEHRSTGQRAWCGSCGEWCYPSWNGDKNAGLCVRGLNVALEAEIVALRERLQERDDIIAAFDPPEDQAHAMLKHLLSESRAENAALRERLSRAAKQCCNYVTCVVCFQIWCKEHGVHKHHPEPEDTP